MIKREEGAVGIVQGPIQVFFRREDFLVGEVDLGLDPALRVIGALTEADLLGEPVLAGVMERDKRRSGLQFRIRGVVDTTLSLAQLRSYLESDLVWHIGPATAEGILSTFGEQAVQVVVFAPERLLEVKGITPNLLPQIRDSLAQSLHLAGIVGLLHPYGISLAVCRAVARRHGSAAAEVIRANPWRLARDFAGVSFRQADFIALRLGKDPQAPERAEAALLHIVAEAASHAGHTVVEDQVAITKAAELLDQSAKTMRLALERLVSSGDLALVAEPAGVARPELALAEQRLATFFATLLGYKADRMAKVTEEELLTLEGRSGLTFDPTQRVAVAGALERGLTVLTGGPGTGKTTMVRAICDLADSRDMSVALMSFTGKAAKRLSEATGRPATTIHRYLRYVPGSGFLGPEEAADVVVVDEVSMLDVLLADELTGWLSSRARLVLVGDNDQLPAIGAGNVLGDLVASPGLPVFRLEVIHRTAEASGIPVLAHAINEGWEVLPYDQRTTYFLSRPSGTEIAAWIRDTLALERNRTRIEDFQVLSPMKKGPAGVDALNGLIAAAVRDPLASAGRAISREAFDMRAGDRIIWQKNDRELGLFNGQIGTLLEVRGNGSALADFEGQIYQVPADRVAANAFSLAYALTVHKAQGSQYLNTIVVCDASALATPLLTRRLLYTAVSRAREKVVVIGQERVAVAAVARHDTHHRQTALEPLLQAALAAAAARVAQAQQGALDPDPVF